MAILTLTLPQALNHALSAYSAGELVEAEELCRQIIARESDQFDALHLLAAIQSRRGKNDEALTTFDRALAVQPNHAEALNNRGIILHRLKRFDEAIASYDRALAVRPDYAEALTNRGDTLRGLKRFDEALASYDRALTVRPDHAEALGNRGAVLHALNRFEDALVSCDRALAVRPHYVEALNNRAAALHELKRFEEALASCDRALSVRPDYAPALYNRGKTLNDLKRFDEALATYDRALALRPDHAEALNNRGDTLRELKRFEEALASYDRALGVRPGYALALCNRGIILHKLKRFGEAVASFERALAVRPDHVEALNNRGAVLHELKRFEEALANYDYALAVRPNYAEALYNRGETLKDLKQFDEALASFGRALAVRPDFAEAHWDEALIRLLIGDFDRGWAKYEWRWKNELLTPAPRDFAQPLWLGDAAIADKTILLHSEQGFGDTIQFCRYSALVATLGARVLLEVPKPLHKLMKSLAGVAQVVCQGEPLPAFDMHCPLLSLPLAFGTRLETIPSGVPYLKSPPADLQHWHARLEDRSRPRVGLAWSGRAAHKDDQNRSIALRALLPLLLDAGATFVSLQKDVRPHDAEVLERREDILDCGDELNDFSATAALIANLDLVISVDTSAAHLAGALAKPVWILLPYVPDWRWLLDCEENPWYPTARLFRQDATRTWDNVIARVHAALHGFVREVHEKSPMTR